MIRGEAAEPTAGKPARELCCDRTDDGPKEGRELPSGALSAIEATAAKAPEPLIGEPNSILSIGP